MGENHKPSTVTRFISQSNKCNLNTMKGKPKAFYTKKDLKDRTISVYDIDEELVNNDNKAIYDLCDKFVYREEPKAIARADIDVADIIEIENDGTPLDVKYAHNISGKHYNIINFPGENEDEKAQHIATQLAFRSRLHIRNS